MPTTPPLQYPAISVVIPMYNTEKYVGACLTSLLNQTFKNFEVIIVDDCSTDKSCEVVESFIPKFEGRLKLYKSKINSGPGVPSNKGLNVSLGKYIFFMDSDDLIMQNAFEILYTMAENSGADLVYMEQGFKFISDDANKIFPEQKDLVGMYWQGNGPFINKPTFDSDDIAARMEIFLTSRIGWPLWEKFIRRDLITENELVLPHLRISQDLIFTIELIFHAKKILRLPYPLYIYRRNNATSLCATKRSDEESILYWTDVNLKGIKFLANFLDEQKFFQENPQYKWALLNFVDGVHFNMLRQIFPKMSPQQVYNIFQKVFTEKFGEYGNLIAYLCNSSNFLRLRLNAAAQHIEQLERQVKELKAK